MFLTLAIHKVHPELGIENIELIPGWLTIIGIIIVSGITSWIGIRAFVVVVAVLVDNEDINMLIIMTLGSIFGFIPIFIYAAWIGLQIRGLR